MGVIGQSLHLTPEASGHDIDASNLEDMNSGTNKTTERRRSSYLFSLQMAKLMCCPSM